MQRGPREEKTHPQPCPLLRLHTPPSVGLIGPQRMEVFQKVKFHARSIMKPWWGTSNSFYTYQHFSKFFNGHNVKFFFTKYKESHEEEKILVLIRLILFLRHPKIILNTCQPLWSAGPFFNTFFTEHPSYMNPIKWPIWECCVAAWGLYSHVLLQVFMVHGKV